MSRLRGFVPTFKIEFLGIVRSYKLWILIVIFALAVIGGALGISGSVGPSPQDLSLNLFAHQYMNRSTGQPGIAAWVSDAWGNPRDGLDVRLLEWNGSDVRIVSNKPKRGDGFVFFENLSVAGYEVTVEGGASSRTTPLTISVPQAMNFTVVHAGVDLEGIGVPNNLLIHALNRYGESAVGARLMVNGEPAPTPLDEFGYGRVHLTTGLNNVTVTYQGEPVDVQWDEMLEHPSDAIGSRDRKNRPLGWERCGVLEWLVGSNRMFAGYTPVPTRPNSTIGPANACLVSDAICA